VSGAANRKPKPAKARPQLSRERIIGTALEIIDQGGIAALSMRKLGAHLGADPMAVYYYLPNKAALYDGVVEAVYSQIDITELDRHAPWRELVTAIMLSLRSAIRRHPNALPVLSTRPAYTPAMFQLGEFALEVMQRAGFAAGTVVDIINCLGTFTVGHVLAEIGEPVGGATATAEDVAELVTELEYPHLAKVFAGGYAFRPEEQYRMGLRAMLDGFENLLNPHILPPRPGLDR
jgi:TetR/AcrR family tetracycline transcriptional repressor